MRKVFAVAAAIMLLCMVGGSALAQKAMLWHYTAEAGWTVANLDPAGATQSYAYGVSGGRQVGVAKISYYYHAGLWSGTAGSWVDLHALLPAGVYHWSEANSIDVSGGEIWVAGDAYPVPEPSSLIALGALLTPLLAFRRRRA